MNEPSDFTVNIYVYGGELESTRLIERPGWSGQGLVFRSQLLGKVLKEERLNVAGVYILWRGDKDEDEEEPLPSVYIGQSGDVAERLRVKKNFAWDRGVIFTSKDQSLNKAHVEYLESSLWSRAKQIGRCNPKNIQQPHPPSLSKCDKNAADWFMHKLLACLPLAGLDFFEMPGNQVGNELYINSKNKNIRAKGYESQDGFVVCIDSQAVKKEVESIHRSLSELRKALLNEQVLVDGGDSLKFTRDYTFRKPSPAAGVVLGSNQNGYETWKDDKGRSLNEIRREEAESL